MVFWARLKSNFKMMPLVAVLALLGAAGCTTGSVPSGPTAAQAQKNQVVGGAPVARSMAPPPQAPNAQPRRIALLLPLSGPQAAVGESLMKASMLAVQELTPPTVEISVHDTAKGAAAAFAAAKAAGAQAVIGPLFSADVQAIRADAAASNIPVLALTNDTNLAGQNTYVMGFWPGAQISRVLTHAQRRGLRNIAVLLPDDAYGRTVEASLTVLTAPARLATVVRYAPASTDYTPVVSQLAQARGQYDALLIPAGGTQLIGLLQALGQQDLLKATNGRPVQLLGSGLWDEPELQKRPELNGAWYAAPDPTARINFNGRYQRAFGDQPVRIASLAYDATALISVLAARNWPYTAQALTQGQGFDGVDGLFRLQTNGLVDRGLAILQFSPTGLQTIEAAPRRF